MKKKNPILKALFRGVVKSIPAGNVALQLVNNVKHELDNKNVINKPDKPHSWISIVTQGICVAAIVYAFVTKTITVEQVLSYLGF